MLKRCSRTVCVALVLLLAACAAPAPTPDPNQILPTSRPLDTPMPSLAAPVYQAANTRITADNASQLRYLGQLGTTASQPSSLFAHAISLDGTRLAAINNDLLVVWDLIDGNAVFTEGRRDVTRVYYAADKSEIYTIGESGTVYANDPVNGADLNTFSTGIAYNGTTDFYAEAGWLAMGGSDGSIQVWDTLNRTSKVTFNAHGAAIRALAFNSDGSRLISAASDGSIAVWDWAARTQVADFSTSALNVQAVAFSPDGSRFSVASSAFVETYSLTADRFLYTLAVGISSTSDVFRYSPDGTYLLTGGSDTAPMVVMRADNGVVVAELPNTSGGRTSAHFSPDSSLLITTVLDGYVTLWNLAEATRDSIPSARLLVGSTRITGAEWSLDGFTLAFFDAPGVVYVWGIP